MRSFLRYLLLLCIFTVVACVGILRDFALEYPEPPGPTFDPRVRKVYIRKLDAERPDMVMLGDSTLLDGVDPQKLSELTGLEVASFDVPGSASAFWYLVLKNNIVEAESRPRYVLILFRDTILTAPGYRVHGSYFILLDEFAARHEPVLLERAYLNLMNPLARFAEAYFPLYSARVEIRREIDARIRYSLPSWLGCDRKCNDKSMYEVFTSADLEPGQLRNAIAAAEAYLYTGDQMDFDRQIERSFLPEIIRLVEENGIELVLVRLKNLTTGERETGALKRYMADLTAYLAEKDVLFLDFGREPRLTRQYYADPLHLTKEGEALFTEMLAERLKEVLISGQEAEK